MEKRPLVSKWSFDGGRGIRIRTLNDGVRDAQCFSKNAHFKHVSRLPCLSNVSVNFVAFLNTKLYQLLQPHSSTIIRPEVAQLVRQ